MLLQEWKAHSESNKILGLSGDTEVNPSRRRRARARNSRRRFRSAHALALFSGGCGRDVRACGHDALPLDGVYHPAHTVRRACTLLNACAVRGPIPLAPVPA